MLTLGGNPGLAGTSDDLKARRSAMLLRIQKSREARRRIDVVRAERMRDEAATAESLACERRDQHGRSQAGRLREAHEWVRGRVIGLRALDKLTAFERDLQAASAVLAANVANAQAIARDREAALHAASALLATEARATRKRERLAETMATASRQAAEAAREAEREDLMTDRWHWG